MKPTILLAIVVASLFAGASLSLAQGAANDGKAVKPPAQEVVLPPGVTEKMLTPPPVPPFMLEKPAKPLTVDEMIQQAREAEKKAGVGPKTGETESKAQTPKPVN